MSHKFWQSSMLRKIFFVCVFLLASCFVIPVSISAADFLVNYDVTYTVSTIGKTSVAQKIALINKQTNLYAKQYSIIIDSTKVVNVTASDSKGGITPEVKNRDGKTEIRLTFNDQVVGQGSILRFALNYDDENIAKKNGSIWEVNIPGVADDQELGDYTIHLVVPKSFGAPAYLVPPPHEWYTWTKEQLVNGGVSGAFGSKQVFELELSYYIENPKNQSIVTEIALPPSTAYQHVILESLTPQPDQIIPDDDGNWLARYRLGKEESKTITADVTVEIFLKPRTVVYPLQEENISRYLAPTEYWTVDDERIQGLVKKLKTPREIYDYVVKTLSYDYSRVNQNLSRKGASVALKTPTTAVCMEYTDLFVTLARAAGIPARQAVGFAYTTNPKLRPLSLVSDILHAWPEYYDSEKKRWIPVDPTWGSTTGGIDYFDKLDFNHIVFAYNGIRDDYPYPAGYYRRENAKGKDVQVHFRDGLLPDENPNVLVNFNIAKRIPGGFPTWGAVEIKNTAKVAAEEIPIEVVSTSFGIRKKYAFVTIPPYGSYTIPVTIRPPHYFSFERGALTASVNGMTYNSYIEVTPAYHIIIPAVIICIWVIITIIFFTRRLLRRNKL